MQYIYHGVPASWTGGDTLYPLFDLRSRHPETFEREIKKYDDHPGRKQLPHKMIGKLNCPRGEVVHFSAVHPGRIFQALKTVFPDGNRSVRFFQIPIERVRGLPTALYDMNRGNYTFGEVEPDEAITLIDPETYTEYSEVPKEAFEFFEEWKARGERGAPAFGRIPHIWVKGPVNVGGCQILDWRDPIG